MVSPQMAQSSVMTGGALDASEAVGAADGVRGDGGICSATLEGAVAVEEEAAAAEL